VYTGIVYALGFGWVFFGSVPGVLSMLGTALILGSAVYVVLARGPGLEEEEKSDVEVGLLEDEK
jgi:drug/metabolite transporter (DMT)-like permease